MKKYKVVRIDWLDAWGKSGWFEEREIDCSGYKVASVGYLVKSNKNGVVIASSISEDGTLLGLSFRPHGMIVKITEIST